MLEFAGIVFLTGFWEHYIVRLPPKASANAPQTKLPSQSEELASSRGKLIAGRSGPDSAVCTHYSGEGPHV